MSQALIDPNNHEEQHYYPLEYLNISNNDYFEQDDYFIDKTASNDIKESNTKCKETRIVRTDIGAFTIREIFLAKWLLFGYFIFPIICITVFLIYKGIELISFIFFVSSFNACMKSISELIFEIICKDIVSGGIIYFSCFLSSE